MTDFLYPFLAGGAADAPGLLADLAASARAKGAASAALRAETLERSAAALDAAGRAVAARLGRGGRLFTFGNGGSSTDASSMASLFSHPPHGRPLPARDLVADSAVLTALGNDVGYDLVFARQLVAHARAGDVAVGFSTSGGSRNVLLAFAEARRRDVLTVGLAGYDGGDFVASADLTHCLVVRSDSVHRIQEVQAALAWRLWELVQRDVEGVPGG